MDFYLQEGNSLSRLINEYVKYKSLIIAVDFDDTLFYFYRQGYTNYMLIDLVRRLNSIGCTIIIWTANQDIDFVKNYLWERNIPYDLINEDADVTKEFVRKKGQTPPRKLYANAYLDDRAGLKQVYDELDYICRNHDKLK